MKKLIAGLLIGLGSLSIESSSAMDVDGNNLNKEKETIVSLQPKSINSSVIFNHCLRIFGVKRLPKLIDSPNEMGIDQNHPNQERRIMPWQQPKTIPGFINNPLFKSNTDCDFGAYMKMLDDAGESVGRIVELLVTNNATPPAGVILEYTLAREENFNFGNKDFQKNLHDIIMNRIGGPAVKAKSCNEMPEHNSWYEKMLSEWGNFNRQNSYDEEKLRNSYLEENMRNMMNQIGGLAVEAGRKAQRSACVCFAKSKLGWCMPGCGWGRTIENPAIKFSLQGNFDEIRGLQLFSDSQYEFGIGCRVYEQSGKTETIIQVMHNTERPRNY